MVHSRVSIVVVSHSPLIAQGTKELAGQMAPDVHIGAVGGDTYGGLGSSFDRTEATVKEALIASGERGVVVLSDLGSATLTVDAVIELGDEGGKVVYAPGPLVEGAVAAAVSAQGDEGVLSVVQAVSQAAQAMCHEAVSSVEGASASPEAAVEVSAMVRDRGGLHARPAAKLAALAFGYDCEIWVDQADATSVLELMALGSSQGQCVTVRAVGPNAAGAAREIANAIEAGFDEQA